MLLKNMLSDNILIIFVKYPQEGFVKTRLAQGIGKKNASELYRLFVETLLARIKDENFTPRQKATPVPRVTRDGERSRTMKAEMKGAGSGFAQANPAIKDVTAVPRVTRDGERSRTIKPRSFTMVIFYTPVSKRNEIKRWLGENLALYPQKGKDLGEKISNAFRCAFKGGAKRAIVIGTDSPTLNKKLILDAFKKLKDTQCVLGPAFDGGYYLIGLASFYEEVFQHINWSSDNVFKQTLGAIKKIRISFSLLDKQLDIDNKDDLSILSQHLPGIYKENPTGLDSLKKFLDKVDIG